MAIAAGATEIYVGDGGVGVSGTNNVMNNAGYSDMISELASRHPGITIETVNLNALGNGWHWISLGSDSSFAGSGYTHYDLSPGSGTLHGHPYYSTSDPQGVNPDGDVLGWYAVSDKTLDADVIINVPKMKTHQLMMATLSIKNLVGCTLSSTYDEGVGDPTARIPHNKTDREENYFNNDIFWRAILDVNKIILYTDEDGILQPTQQRMYLNVIDGIQAMERSQHHVYGGGGIPYDSHVVVAGVDPVAVDAVACRLMGYDFNAIPSIANADSDTIHPIGTNDPENIAIVGEVIDSEIDHVFEFNSAWAEYAGELAITDFTPPMINSIDKQDNTVTADIAGGLVAYILYQMDGVEHIEEMTKDGNVYSVTVPETVSEYWILAQDEHFNTVFSTAVVLSINAPDRVPEDYDFTVTVDINSVTDLNGAQYDVTFDSTVLRLDDVTDGQIDSTAFPVIGFSEIAPGTYRILNSLMSGTVSGSGHLAVLHFHVIGSLGDSTAIELSNGALSGIAGEIPANWVGDFVEVSVCPGDANGDRVINVLDMTKVARIILQMDPETPGADANQDGVVNVLDTTKIARIILLLDPHPCP